MEREINPTKNEVDPTLLNINVILEMWMRCSFAQFLKDDESKGSRISQWMEEEATEEERSKFVDYYYSYVNKVGKFCETFLNQETPPVQITYYKQGKL